MNEIKFYKYQATGNDFILIDNRVNPLKLDLEAISKLCDRKFGIGSDGLILIENHDSYDFEMVFFNPDGSQSLCGNGSRCAVAFAKFLGIIVDKTEFQAYDGAHTAEILPSGDVKLKMSDVQNVRLLEDGTFVDTGSPHLVKEVINVKNYRVYDEGKKIRNGGLFKVGGVNVNFVEPLSENQIYVRTYERGVEDETLSCGTGVTASALASGLKGLSSPIAVCTKGGNLEVDFVQKDRNHFTDIYLIGPAKPVFDGVIDLNQVLTSN